MALFKLDARIRKTASWVQLAFATACLETGLLRHVAVALIPAPA